jgi:hypothetical protein
LLSKEHEELKLKIERIKNETNDSLEMEQSIPCAIPIFKVDASTSCIDLLMNLALTLAMRNAMRMLL